MPSLERALQIWREKGLLTAEQIDQLRRGLDDEVADSGTGRGILIFSTIGAMLVGLGVLLFVGSNWERMGPVLRTAIVFGSYGLVCLAAWAAGQRQMPRIAESLWFLATLMLGGAIFLLAQIFNFSLTFWQGPGLWLVGTLAMAYARRKAAYAVLAVPLAVLSLGWLGGGSGWFMDDQLEFLVTERGLLPLLPLIGVSFMSLGLLARRFADWAFAANALIAWGGLIVASVLVVSTADDHLLRTIFRIEFTPKQIAITTVAIMLAVAAGLVGSSQPQARLMLAGTGLLSLAFLVQLEGRSWLGILVSSHTAAFAAYVIAVFGLAMASVWLGVRALNRHLINLGIASSSIIILIQYFAWSFEMLPTSFAFILGGLVLIILSVVMERTRRAMIARVRDARSH